MPKKLYYTLLMTLMNSIFGMFHLIYVYVIFYINKDLITNKCQKWIKRAKNEEKCPVSRSSICMQLCSVSRSSSYMQLCSVSRSCSLMQLCSVCRSSSCMQLCSVSRTVFLNGVSGPPGGFGGFCRLGDVISYKMPQTRDL